MHGLTAENREEVPTSKALAFETPFDSTTTCAAVRHAVSLEWDAGEGCAPAAKQQEQADIYIDAVQAQQQVGTGPLPCWPVPEIVPNLSTSPQGSYQDAQSQCNSRDFLSCILLVGST